LWPFCQLVRYTHSAKALLVPVPAPPAMPDIFRRARHDRHSAALLMTRQGREFLRIDTFGRSPGCLFA
ncbi:MAG TPA: hypothetical protein VFQ89_11885, partial [Candidatus Binatia bacterium]|nr:hypothetical protein [Candidatus Binatia bacterium]